MAARIGHRLLCPISIDNQQDKGYMSVICTRCGSTNVICMAMVNPNGNVFEYYPEEAFEYGYCRGCDFDEVHAELTDTDKVQQEIDILYRSFIDSYETEPDYADCRIVYKDNGTDLEVKIALTADNKAAAMNERVFYHCDGISGLKSLAEYGDKDFIMVQCYQFDNWAGDNTPKFLHNYD